MLLIDEAQQVCLDCLTELRLLQSHHFDSQSLLFTILCGDKERLRKAVESSEEFDGRDEALEILKRLS